MTETRSVPYLTDLVDLTHPLFTDPVPARHLRQTMPFTALDAMLHQERHADPNLTNKVDLCENDDVDSATSTHGGSHTSRGVSPRIYVTPPSIRRPGRSMDKGKGRAEPEPVEHELGAWSNVSEDDDRRRIARVHV
ncbi:hypothetical protein H0H93_007564 [Arthromyces matolae]|nr:hypothetical protein H0H93_007564 [Arthromyces matolae]